jgi:hypothetical protein
MDEDGLNGRKPTARRRGTAPTSRRRRRERRTAGRVARSGGRQRERFLVKPGVREVDWAGGTARSRRVADAGGRCRHGEKQRGGERDGGEGSYVINSKFKIPVCKLNFSPYSKGQMKKF